ncbi:MAG TPA: hypothetical protein V6D29_04690 [Leptolyngbyaceae cyanobacterium]
MKLRLLGCLSILSTCGFLVLSTPAEAALLVNNGFKLNGLSVNGFRINGLSINGLSLNGLSMNGLSMNGMKLNGSSLDITEFQEAGPQPIRAEHGQLVLTLKTN